VHVISRKRLLNFINGGAADAAGALEEWFRDAKASQWEGPTDIKARYPHASFLASNRVIFNICGNRYRLITAVKYAQSPNFKGKIFIRWVGTHAEYDKIDANTI